MSQKKNILLCYNYLASFVKKDVEILSSAYHITSHDFHAKKKSDTPFRFLSQLIFLLKNIAKTDLIICEFASYHSLLPALFGRLFGKPCLVIVGGTDAHYFPALQYGNWQKRFLNKATALTFQWCSHIAPKHHSLMKSNYNYDTTEPAQQGIYARLPELKTPFTEITNGYDSVKWHGTQPKKKNSFITVCSGWEFPFQYQLKGIDLIVAMTPLFPHCEFTILGVPDESLIPEKYPNLKILPPVKNELLSDVLSRHEFYLQLSIAEGFPNSLCEAMLCECVPIGSNVFSIPEIIGNSGFVLNKRNTDELKKLIETAIQSDTTSLGKAARKRIADNYTLEMRRKNLLKLCERLLSGDTV